MNIETKEINASGIKVIGEVNGEFAARGYVYFMTNDLEKTPFALLEDVFVEEKFRGQKLSSLIIEKIIELAKERKCHKIICTSKMDREGLHKYYEKLGFEKRSFGFRMDL
jgi:GNAT superfamily N-acetyltransferase